MQIEEYPYDLWSRDFKIWLNRLRRADLIAALAAADGVALPDMEEAADAIELRLVRVEDDGAGGENVFNISALPNAANEFVQVKLTDQE